MAAARDRRYRRAKTAGPNRVVDRFEQRGRFLRVAAGTLRSSAAAALVVLAASGASAQPPSDSQISTAAQTGAAWLVSQQNCNSTGCDGSWGSAGDDAERMLFTAEAVQALRALDLLGPSYLHGIMWLENHTAPNNDLAARRLLALAPHGDTLTDDRSQLESARMTNSGWGVTASYGADPLDTALVMEALGVSAGFFQTYQGAIASLENSWIGSGTSFGCGSGPDTWTIGQPDAALTFEGDIPSTVAVAKTLRRCNATASTVAGCSDANLASALNPVECALANTFDPTHTDLEVALVAGYFTPLVNPLNPASLPSGISLVNVRSMMSRLVLTDQGADGSWNDDVLTTALAIHAFGSWLGLDGSGQPTDPSTVVAISSAGLRRAVNAALKSSAMDTVTTGDLWRLTTLDLSYASTGSVMDLINLKTAGAKFLTTIDISGNECLLPSLATLQANFPTVYFVHHPVGDVNQDDQVNALDQELLLAELLQRATLMPSAVRAADLTQDGRLDTRDLYWLERVLMQRDITGLCHPG